MTLEILLAINRYGHDFSSALWVSGVILLYIIHKEARGIKGQVPGEFIVRIYRRLNILLWISFILIFFCGTVRALTYRQFEWNEKMGQLQVQLLFAKHIIFFLILLSGLSVWWKVHRYIVDKR